MPYQGSGARAKNPAGRIFCQIKILPSPAAAGAGSQAAGRDFFLAGRRPAGQGRIFIWQGRRPALPKWNIPIGICL